MRWLVIALFGLVIAFAGFALTLTAVPGFIMSRAMDGIETSGAPINGVWHVPPTDETSRRVVRPSPDILYSLCLYDLSDGALEITLPPADPSQMVSVSFFDADTNNFSTLRWRNGFDVRLYRPDPDAPVMSDRLEAPPLEDLRDRMINSTWVKSPSRTGIVLYRRILTGDVSIEDAEADRQGFACRTGQPEEGERP